MNIVLDIILPVFGVVFIGYVAGRFSWIGREAIEGLSTFVFNFAIPALLFRSLATAELPADIPWGYLISYYAGVFTVFALGIAAARFWFAQPLEGQGIFALGAGFSNTVLLGIPLILTAFGEQASVPIFLIISFHSFLLMPTVTTIIEFGRGQGESVSQLWITTFKSLFTNPIILGLLAGMTFNLFSFGIPHALDSVAQMLGAAATPGALFAMGASLSQYRVAGNLSEAGVLSVFKLIVHPSVVWLLATFVFQIEPLWIAVAVVMAAMPTGVNMYLFAQRYKVAVAEATTTVLLCTALSVVTLSGLLFLLLD